MSMDMTATELMQREARFRSRVMAAVAQAMDDARQHIREEDLRWKDMHHVATDAAVTALKSAFDNDAEIQLLRMERDHYQKLALAGLATSPLTVRLDTHHQGPQADR